MEAEITMEYDDELMAESIAQAVSPDNSVNWGGLSVITKSESGKIITRIVCHREFRTFVATVDDLLFSLVTAEKTLHEIKKLRMQVGV